MNTTFASLLSAACIALALPAAAGSVTVELPRLTFPDGGSGTVGQGCASPATLTAPACGAGGN